jgi:Ser/Thr protein kinase RdoA (MazF antagonist)
VSGSHSKDVVETPDQAYEAAKQFGRFTKQLSGIDITQLHYTIPAFHDLSLRHRQFLQALQDGNAARIEETGRMIQQLLQWSPIETQYRQLVHNPDFRLRVTHHDTKISNVLFDNEDKCICVIDLDTVMPGYFISDVGDMMRTYLSPVSEEEEDFTKIEVRTAFYEAVVSGYFSEMKDELTKTEKEHFFYAGTFMIYMQALRFLTDYLNNDEYYGARYPGHNRIRAENQVVLLQRLLEKQHVLEGILLESV